MYADADAVVQIVKALTMRAAALISTALAGVIKAIANEKHSYAISGLTNSIKGWPCKLTGLFSGWQYMEILPKTG